MTGFFAVRPTVRLAGGLVLAGGVLFVMGVAAVLTAAVAARTRFEIRG